MPTRHVASHEPDLEDAVLVVAYAGGLLEVVFCFLIVFALIKGI